MNQSPPSRYPDINSYKSSENPLKISSQRILDRALECHTRIHIYNSKLSAKSSNIKDELAAHAVLAKVDGTLKPRILSEFRDHIRSSPSKRGDFTQKLDQLSMEMAQEFTGKYNQNNSPREDWENISKIVKQATNLSDRIVFEICVLVEKNATDSDLETAMNSYQELTKYKSNPSSRGASKYASPSDYSSFSPSPNKDRQTIQNSNVTATSFSNNSATSPPNRLSDQGNNYGKYVATSPFNTTPPNNITNSAENDKKSGSPDTNGQGSNKKAVSINSDKKDISEMESPPERRYKRIHTGTYFPRSTPSDNGNSQKSSPEQQNGLYDNGTSNGNGIVTSNGTTITTNTTAVAQGINKVTSPQSNHIYEAVTKVAQQGGDGTAPTFSNNTGGSGVNSFSQAYKQHEELVQKATETNNFGSIELTQSIENLATFSAAEKQVQNMFTDSPQQDRGFVRVESKVIDSYSPAQERINQLMEEKNIKKEIETDMKSYEKQKSNGMTAPQQVQRQFTDYHNQEQKNQNQWQQQQQYTPEQQKYVEAQAINLDVYQKPLSSSLLMTEPISMTLVDTQRVYQSSIFLKSLQDSEFAPDWVCAMNSKTLEIDHPSLDTPIFQQPHFRWILHQRGEHCAFESGAFPDHYLRKGDRDACSLVRLNNPFQVEYAIWKLHSQQDGTFYRIELLADGSYLSAQRTGDIECTKSLGKWANFKFAIDVGRPIPIGTNVPHHTTQPVNVPQPQANNVGQNPAPAPNNVYTYDNNPLNIKNETATKKASDPNDFHSPVIQRVSHSEAKNNDAFSLKVQPTSSDSPIVSPTISPTRSSLKKKKSLKASSIGSPDGSRRSKSPEKAKSVVLDTSENQVYVYEKMEEDWEDPGKLLYLECQKKDMRGMYLVATKSKTLKFIEPIDYLTYKDEIEFKWTIRKIDKEIAIESQEYPGHFLQGMNGQLRIVQLPQSFKQKSLKFRLLGGKILESVNQGMFLEVQNANSIRLTSDITRATDINLIMPNGCI